MNYSKLKKQIVNIEMSLIAKGVNIKKHCNNEFEVYMFERDMPAKNGLLFSKKPYLIGKKYL